MVGFGLYGSIHGPTDYRVSIQIIHSETSTVAGQNETGFSCDGSWKTFRVMFKEPIEIMQNQFYTASATLLVSDTLLFVRITKKINLSFSLSKISKIAIWD